VDDKTRLEEAIDLIQEGLLDLKEYGPNAETRAAATTDDVLKDNALAVIPATDRTTAGRAIGKLNIALWLLKRESEVQKAGSLATTVEQITGTVGRNTGPAIAKSAGIVATGLRRLATMISPAESSGARKENTQ
jgi:hypothetical protein